jgi:hypothetical protein
VLLNPWVRTEEGLAKAYLKGYYLRRVLSLELWKSLLSGKVNPLASLRSLTAMVRRVAGGSRAANASGSLEEAAGIEMGVDARAARTKPEAIVSGANAGTTAPRIPPGPLPERMAAGWRRYPGPILLILSGEDLTAAEFRDVAAQSPAWQGLLDAPRVTRRELPEANHTFGRRVWREQVADWTRDWVISRGGEA